MDVTVPEATMAARLTRAKKKIAQARIPFRLPSPDELPQRLDSVLTAVHLLYSTGHTAATGAELVRVHLHFRGEAHTITAAEVALVLALVIVGRHQANVARKLARPPRPSEG